MYKRVQSKEQGKVRLCAALRRRVRQAWHTSQQGKGRVKVPGTRVPGPGYPHRSWAATPCAVPVIASGVSQRI